MLKPASLAMASIAFAVSAHADDTAAPRPGSLAGVVVNGVRESSDNYRVDNIDSIGPLGTTPILDSPFSIAVLPSDLLRNSQAVNFKDVSKYLPLVAYQEQQGPDVLRPQTRGMQGGNFQNTKIDGMTMFVTLANAIEQFEQIEVVNGVSASLYGPANPSGMFNFVSKRPAEQDFRDVTVSYASDYIASGKVDISGHIDPNGIVKYRFNGVFASGGGYVRGSHEKRVLGDLGIDVRPWDSTLLELNFSEYALTNLGFPGWFTYGEAIRLPSTPDPQRQGFNQEYLGVQLKTQISEMRLKQDLGSNWHFVAGILNQDGTRNMNTQVNNLTDSAGDYTSSMGSTFAPRFVITSDTAYLNGRLDTFGLNHDLTLGTAGYRSSSYALTTTPTAARLLLGTASMSDPVAYPYPALGVVNTNANFDSSDVYQQGINLNDQVRMGEHWAVRAGVSQDWFHTNNFKNTGARTTQYSNDGLSYSGSVLFKPLQNMTTYATFASSLQAGDLAPAGTTNAGDSLAPYRSKEYEVGYKADFGRINFTAALFRIERPFANISPAKVFQTSGEQINRGLELSAVGELLQGLTLFGGVTLLDAKMEDTPLASTNDKIYVGAPKIKGNTLLEYQIPGVAGLVVSFDYQFTGTRPANDTNSFFAAGYNLFDLGARYIKPLNGASLTVRLAVDNLTDRRYWSTIAPSNLTGANTGSLLAHFGTPRTALASVSMEF